jgi:hypothetical protein
MPIQLIVLERRDSVDRDVLGNATLAMCRSVRSREGIRSSRFYWYGPDTVVIFTEGEAAALNAPIDEAYARARFELADLAKMTMNWRLVEPKTGVEAYHLAGR